MSRFRMSQKIKCDGEMKPNQYNWKITKTDGACKD